MGKLAGKQGKVLVAVSFDENASRLVRCAAALCRETGMTMRLTHVTEPIFRSYVSYAQPMTTLRPEIFQAIEDDAVTVAESRLRELKQEAKDVTVETDVPIGPVVEGILSSVKSSGASVVIVGSQKGAHKMLVRGFSTAMALMSESPVPVVAIPGESNLDFAKDHLRLMIADDLREETRPAVESTFELAERLGASDVLQLHVSSMSEDIFKTAMHGALAAAHNTGDVSASDLWTLARNSMIERTAERAKAQKLSFKAIGGRIKTLCEVGPINEEILRQTTTFQPDLAVFGRHERFHGKSLAYGQLPLHMMLALERPIMIVPNAKASGR